VTVDVGFGDDLEPGAGVIDYPSMLDLPAPRLRAYARETISAKKIQAMAALECDFPYRQDSMPYYAFCVRAF
jgi:hypothetical protein